MSLALIHLDTKHGDGQKFGDVNGIQGKDWKGCAILFCSFIKLLW